MPSKPQPDSFAESCAIPCNRISLENLPPEVRDLAELLAEIVARRVKAGIERHPTHKEIQGGS